MMGTTFTIPRSDPQKLSFIQQLAAALPSYAETLAVSADELAYLNRCAASFKYALDFQTAVKAAAESAVALKNVVRDGPKDTPPTPPVLPVLALPEGGLVADVFGWAGALATRLKANPNYTEAIGLALGIIGVKSAAVDPSSVQPVLAVEFQQGHPNIVWTKSGMDALEIEVDRDDGKFGLLTIDTIPDYLDTAPLPAAGTSALWRYRAIYRLKDERVGHWSQVLEVAVKGV